MLVEAWRVTLLGDCKAEQTRHIITRFRTRKAASLFGFLACHPGRAHAREELAERFWPEDEPETARTKLRLALASLRRQLEPPGTQTGTVLFADRTHLRLNVHAIETDVAAFEAGLRAARQAQEPSDQIALLEQAAHRYGGDLLPGDYEEWTLHERERLKAAYIHALEQLVEGLTNYGDLDKPIAYARLLVTTDSLNEAAHVALMRLYARSNRPQEATRQYQELQHVLRQQLEAEPGQEAQALARTLPSLPDGGSKAGNAGAKSRRGTKRALPGISIDAAALPASAPSVIVAVSSSSASSVAPASHEAAVGLANAQPVTASSPSAPVPRPLPLFLTRCIAREQDVDALCRMLLQEEDYAAALPNSLPAMRWDTPLLTLVGPGGTGKTRLAVETARKIQPASRLAVAFVSLADIAEPERILPALADAFQLPPVESDAEFERLVEHLRPLSALVVLDNFEQLTPGGSFVVEQLLTRLPRLSFLVTSRHPLGIGGERIYAVPPLSTSGAMQLFADRAQASRPDFQITPRSREVVTALCERLEGLPFAIELAAAWAGALTPAQMLAQLEGRLNDAANSPLDLLVSRGEDRLPRHRTLRAAIAWSVDLLNGELRTFFMRLAVFRGSWNVEAAQTVCSQPAALHLLAQLRAHSLVVAEESRDGSDMRFRLLESIREFASEALPPNDEPPLRRSHSEYFLQLAETADREFNGPEQSFWFESLEREHDNIRAALAWFARNSEDVERELRLTSAMQVFWWTRGYLAEGRKRLDTALQRPGIAAYPKAQRGALAAAGILANMQRDYATGRMYHARALDIARHNEDWPGIAIALGSLGNIAKNIGDYARARVLYQQCLEISERFGHQTMCATAIGNLGNVAKETGEYCEAQSLYERCLELHRTRGNKQGMTIVLGNLAGLLGEMGESEGALPFAQECLELCRELGDKEGTAFALEVFAELAHARRQWNRAIRLYAAANGMRDRIGTPLSDPDEATRQARLTLLRAQTGSKAFDALWTAETEARFEQAVQFALEAQPKTVAITLRRSG